MAKLLATLCVVCLLSVPVAAAPAAAQPGAPAAQGDGWEVRLALSGGFAGFDRELQIWSSGQLTVVDRRRNKQVETVVAPAELARLAAVVRQAEPKVVTRNHMCNDCFSYAVTGRVDTRTFSASVDDTTLGASGLAPLVRALIDLQDRTLASHPD